MLLEIHIKELKVLLKKLYRTQECHEIFEKYSEHSAIINDPNIGMAQFNNNYPKGCMRIDEFENFLIQEQKLKLTNDQLVDEINKILQEN